MRPFPQLTRLGKSRYEAVDCFAVGFNALNYIQFVLRKHRLNLEGILRAGAKSTLR
jgi:hypothetical protein